MPLVSHLQEKLRELVQKGEFGTVWSKYKKNFSTKTISKDNPYKKDFDKLLKEFDSGLTGVLKKFQSAKTFEDSIKYANRGSSICVDYKSKCKKFMGRCDSNDPDEAELKRLASVLNVKLENIDKLLLSTIKRIMELHQEEEDDGIVDAKLKQLAKDGKLKKYWSQLKKAVLAYAQTNQDKEEVKGVLKLYKEFDSNLTAVIKAFDKCSSVDKAKPIAEKGISICDDYRQKAAASEAVSGKPFLTLVASLDALKKVFEDAVYVIKS